MEVDPKVYTVIIAGGAGTRLWPLSRREHPKPFLPGKDGRSLLRATFDRALGYTRAENVIVVVARDLLTKVADELGAIPRENLLGEPVGRNTAAAIGLAASVISERDSDALLSVLPADHVIADEGAFIRSARSALELAAQGEVVTLGISPTRPETGYGYLWLGESLAPGQFRLRQFVEKPSRERAEAFASSGEHLWNSGTFFFAARTMLSAMDTLLPQLAAGLREIEREAKQSSIDRALSMHFAALPSISIDYGVMEKLPKIACVAADCGWDDIGTLASYAELAPTSTPIEIKASQNIYLGERKLVAVIGESDLIIVETAEALVICKRQESQSVKELVALLEKKRKKRAAVVALFILVLTLVEYG